MNTLYSICRPNEGNHRLDTVYKKTPIEKGLKLAERIGHRISHKVVISGGSNPKLSRLYTAEKNGEVVTGYIEDLTYRLFTKVDSMAVRKAARTKRLIQGWRVKAE